MGRSMCVLTPLKSQKEKGPRTVTAAREPYSSPGDPQPQGAVLGDRWTRSEQPPGSWAGGPLAPPTAHSDFVLLVQPQTHLGRAPGKRGTYRKRTSLRTR